MTKNSNTKNNNDMQHPQQFTSSFCHYQYYFIAVAAEGVDLSFPLEGIATQRNKLTVVRYEHNILRLYDCMDFY